MKQNKVKVSGRQKDRRALERIKESNVRLYKNGLTSARGKLTNLGCLKN
jgi:hypothetical protein